MRKMIVKIDKKKVAMANGRNFIGIEINPDYYPEIQSKTQQNGFILRAEKSLAGRMRPYSSCPMTQNGE